MVPARPSMGTVGNALPLLSMWPSTKPATVTEMTLLFALPPWWRRCFVFAFGAARGALTLMMGVGALMGTYRTIPLDVVFALAMASRLRENLEAVYLSSR